MAEPTFRPTNPDRTGEFLSEIGEFMFATKSLSKIGKGEGSWGDLVNVGVTAATFFIAPAKIAQLSSKALMQVIKASTKVIESDVASVAAKRAAGQTLNDALMVKRGYGPPRPVINAENIPQREIPSGPPYEVLDRFEPTEAAIAEKGMVKKTYAPNRDRYAEDYFGPKEVEPQAKRKRSVFTEPEALVPYAQETPVGSITSTRFSAEFPTLDKALLEERFAEIDKMLGGTGKRVMRETMETGSASKLSKTLESRRLFERRKAIEEALIDSNIPAESNEIRRMQVDKVLNEIDPKMAQEIEKLDTATLRPRQEGESKNLPVDTTSARTSFGQELDELQMEKQTIQELLSLSGKELQMESTGKIIRVLRSLLNKEDDKRVARLIAEDIQNIKKYGIQSSTVEMLKSRSKRIDVLSKKLEEYIADPNSENAISYSKRNIVEKKADGKSDWKEGRKYTTPRPGAKKAARSPEEPTSARSSELLQDVMSLKKLYREEADPVKKKKLFEQLATAEKLHQKEIKRVSTQNFVDAGGKMPSRVETFPQQKAAETVTKPEAKGEFTIHSGGADGADTVWAEAADAAGIRTIGHSYKGHDTLASVKARGFKGERPELETRNIISEEDLKLADKFLEKAAKGLNERFDPSVPWVNMFRRNYYQVRDSDAVIAIAELKPGMRKTSGGTRWAVQMGIDKGVPTYVFDQNKKAWFKWTGKVFEEIEFPPAFKNFAGVGSRDLKESGRDAIRKYVDSLYRKDYKDSDGFNKFYQEVQDTPKSQKALMEKEAEQKSMSEMVEKTGKESLGTVVRVKDKVPGAIDIGRSGKFGNPFVVSSKLSVTDAVAKYRVWLWNKIKTDPDYAKSIHNLKGKTLACPGSEANEACHGQIILKAIKYLDEHPEFMKGK